jgi:sterol desaturase/sphingolipid hydroxylase (fatty acid hydroxylase superfamily)
VLAAAFGALLMAERRRRLRPTRDPGVRRVGRNMALAGISAVTLQLAERPLVIPLSRWVRRRRLGLTQRLPLPATLCDALAVVLMDYTLYLWHLVMHKVPWLYRFHQVHHSDLDLDTSTALRFHGGEFVVGMPWRAAQILLLGTSPGALRTWQQLTLLSVLFHHSNLELPERLERWLGKAVMTPRLHGIHHSIVRREQDSNWSSGLTLWDRLHGTFREDVPQGAILVGIPALRDPRQLTLPRLISLPFRAGQPEPWRLPDGSEPRRTPSPAGLGAADRQARSRSASRV